MIEDWAAALREGDAEAAAENFELPSVAQNGTPPLELESREDVVRFNRALPCGAELVRAEEDGRFTVATFERPAARPGRVRRGSATGQHGVCDPGRLITEWIRAARTSSQSRSRRPRRSRLAGESPPARLPRWPRSRSTESASTTRNRRRRTHPLHPRCGQYGADVGGRGSGAGASSVGDRLRPARVHAQRAARALREHHRDRAGRRRRRAAAGAVGRSGDRDRPQRRGCGGGRPRARHPERVRALAMLEGDALGLSPSGLGWTMDLPTASGGCRPRTAWTPSTRR